ncbi:rhomboid family intramembrane serine protease [Chryseobacterium sp. GMJ5]|uniref:Rhomboid family intramembrane serine protease n=1 Tax=Chryseobacterium gilvum TaxID=2976534 RepID=A0ABT2VY93_9FLAO|nr:rhomboid family intramembrane serine protease [Chryseobacterium gilvum]MCU7614588.1 rhomboid family intramembrane serine protease [Chryseobacterium gilvum]
MFNTIPPITRNLIILNIVVFIVSYLFPQLGYVLTGFYPFSPNFKSWQIITHMFMHGGIVHIAFNMLTLFSFGPILEQSLGGKKYLILYFLSGLGAFFLFNAWNFIEIQKLISQLQEMNVDVSEIYSRSNIGVYGYSETIYLKNPMARQLYEGLAGGMVGASGAIFGVIAAFATLYPESKIGIMFIPIPVKVKYVLPIVIIVSIYLGVFGNSGGIAHLAHVGGAIVGFILARIWRKHLYRFN